MTSNVQAFLAMLSHSEGTDRYPLSDHGYNVLVGGSLFTGYADHPRKLVRLSATLSSTAAGRYQVMERTYDDLHKRAHIPDFTPSSQDAMAVELIRECGALPLIEAGQFAAAVAKVAHIWASLPGAGYGQRENKLAALETAYVAAGGVSNG